MKAPYPYSLAIASVKFDVGDGPENSLLPIYRDWLSLFAKAYFDYFDLCICRTVSALAHWSPLFGETDYLPMLTFPFVKLFQNNQLICFEMLATVLSEY